MIISPSDKSLINLKIISQIKEFDKIYINREGYIAIEKKNLFQGMLRYFYKISHNDNINDIIIIYNIIFNIINDLLNQETSDMQNSLESFIIALQDSIFGLDNLKKTYYFDTVFTSKLDILIINIQSYINKINNHIDNTI